MQQKATHADYREQLKSEYKRRQTVNPRYSLRAFARDLGLSSGFLSLLLNGKKKLSDAKAIELAEVLGLGPSGAEEFYRLVRLNNARTEKAQALIAREGRNDSVGEFSTLNLDAFQVISDWYHYAITELTYCKDFKPTAEWVGRRLGISTETAKAALERLVRLGLLKKSGRTLVKTEAFIATPTDRPSASLRSFHGQMIEKAKQALTTQSVDERDITGITIALDREKLAMAKKEIRRFRQRMAKLLEGGSPSSVYQLNVQLFNLCLDSNKEKTK